MVAASAASGAAWTATSHELRMSLSMWRDWAPRRNGRLAEIRDYFIIILIPKP